MRLTFKSQMAMGCLLFAALTVNPAMVRAEQIFYSIHYGTATNLMSLETQVNALRVKGLTVFWEKSELPDMGAVYRIYVGRFKGWDEAVAFREQLKQTESKKYLGIQWFADTSSDSSGRHVAVSTPEKKGVIDRPSPAVIQKDRFLDNQDGTITDTKTGLMWLKNGRSIEFISAATWSEAIDRLTKFSYGNYKDWRLATLEEWSSLIDPDYQDPAMVEPNPFVNIVTHMPYWTQTESTYSRYHTYSVVLFLGSIQKQKKSDRAFILPVRTIEKKGG